MNFKRIFVLVLDSLGVGEAIDANNYGDNGSNTLKHVMDTSTPFIPNLKKLGFLNTINLDDNPNVEAYYTSARPTNVGKDSLSGHYELMGIESKRPFKAFSETGMPRELIEKIEHSTILRVMGNKNGDGQDIINELGDRHMDHPSLIIYTSSDSSLYVAAHEDVIPLPKLYTCCEIIRKITLNEDWKVARVIARPFTGKDGKYKFNNSERMDYAVKPPQRSVLNNLKNHEFSVISIGKINSIFDGEGITKIVNSPNNNIDTLNKLTDIMSKNFTGLCITNLNDFDIYGHKRDVSGYAGSLEELDVEIPMVLNKLENDDLLIITADHGNDPTFAGAGHTRENVPVLIYSRTFKESKKLEMLPTMADIGATIADNFQVEQPYIGKSFLEKLK